MRDTKKVQILAARKGGLEKTEENIKGKKENMSKPYRVHIIEERVDRVMKKKKKNRKESG